METFLQLVANDLYRRFGNDLSRTALIFPNKRANLFFSQHLANCSNRPLWSPTYLTISELFCSLSDLTVESPIRSVCLLHRLFNEATHHNESLDDFYFWGELLLSDFDDLDKNLVKAKSLFTNLEELKRLSGDTDFLTEEQWKAINRFFNQLYETGQQAQEGEQPQAPTSNRGLLKENFAKLWQALEPLYEQLRQQLLQDGKAYEGMLYRDVIEHFPTQRLTFDRYVLVGFNVLNKVERELFRRLNETGKALFYWDYDLYYQSNPHHEAGTFIRENLREFGNALENAAAFDHLGHLPEITLISASTGNIQARYLHNWLQENLTPQEQETAVVLCDEELTLPVLHAFPEGKVQRVNITMGFPLRQTPVYTLVDALLNLQVKGTDSQQRFLIEPVTAVLTHPYVQQLTPCAAQVQQELTAKNRFFPTREELQKDPLLTLLFTLQPTNERLLTWLGEVIDQVGLLFKKQATDHDAFSQLYEESLFKTHQVICNFRSLQEEGLLEVQPEMLSRLLHKVLSTASIPFHGEPAVGLQVMGVLETRNLDFRHLILLSLNEGKLPHKGADASFIPYSLRAAFEMTTIPRQNAVYAYYFYRMIQRAERVTLVYENGTDGLNQEEPSRFIRQLLVEFPGIIKQQSLQARQRIEHTPLSIPQTEETRRKLRQRFGFTESRAPLLSPSALNCYLDCRLRFYLRYVENLRAVEEISAAIDSPTFGNLFHHSAQLMYQWLTLNGKRPVLNADDLQKLAQNQVQLGELVDQAFREVFFHIEEREKPAYDGQQLINRSVICNYLSKLLLMDATSAPFTYIGSELPIYRNVTLMLDGRPFTVRLGGYIDRMDRRGNQLRIIDYKTGGKTGTLNEVSQLFQTDGKRENYIFQAFYYAQLVYHVQHPDANGQYTTLTTANKQPLQLPADYSLQPTLLYIRQTHDATFEPCIQIGKEKEPLTDYSKLQEEFSKELEETIRQIFQSEQPYAPTSNEEACKYCDFKQLCGREVPPN